VEGWGGGGRVVDLRLAARRPFVGDCHRGGATGSPVAAEGEGLGVDAFDASLEREHGEFAEHHGRRETGLMDEELGGGLFVIGECGEQRVLLGGGRGCGWCGGRVLGE
jgi:hypothetical protein